MAFLFTGQGSQYIDMGLDMAERYEIVAQTFAEADAVMLPELGRPLTDFIRRDPTIDADAQFEQLRATEISQPATLTVDVERLVASGTTVCSIPFVFAAHGALTARLNALTFAYAYEQQPEA